jgi:hypothetical protein
MMQNDILLAEISLRLPVMQAMRLALSSKAMLETVGTFTKKNRPEYKLVRFTVNFAEYIRQYMMERYQLETVRYLRKRDSDWSWCDDNLSSWNRLSVFVKDRTVPTLELTFDCGTSLNTFNLWWYLPYNRGSTALDITFENDSEGSITYFTPKAYSEGLWQGLLENGYLPCEEDKRSRKRKSLD